MEELQALKELIKKKPFSRKATKSLNAILDKAIERGYLYEDEKKAMRIIMDYELQVSEIRGSYLEKQQYLWQEYYNNVLMKIGKFFENIPPQE